MTGVVSLGGGVCCEDGLVVDHGGDHNQLGSGRCNIYDKEVVACISECPDCGPVLFFVIHETFALDSCVVGLPLVLFQGWEERGNGWVVEDCVRKRFGPGHKELAPEWACCLGNVA